jgi:hypothetical protein
MSWFLVEFIDGKDTTVEADAYPEQRDKEWLFRRGDEVVAQYQCHEVRGIQKLPGVAKTRGGGSY